MSPRSFHLTLFKDNTLIGSVHRFSDEKPTSHNILVLGSRALLRMVGGPDAFNALLAVDQRWEVTCLLNKDGGNMFWRSYGGNSRRSCSKV